MRARFFGGVLLVDPRPIALGELSHPRQSDYHDDLVEIVAERRRVLAELGIDTARGLPVMPECHPLLSAPPGQRVVRGCPEEQTVVALLDTLRAGAEQGTWVVRSMPIIYRPGVGREATISDMVIGRQDGAWVVLERRRLGLFER